MIMDFFKWIWDPVLYPKFHPKYLVETKGPDTKIVLVKCRLFNQDPPDREYQIYEQIEKNKSWIFIVLTKYAEGLTYITPPSNAIVGAWVWNQKTFDEANINMPFVKTELRMIYCSPIESIDFRGMTWCKWLVLGDSKEYPGPKVYWDLIASANCSVFCRPMINIVPMQHIFRQASDAVKEFREG